MNTTNREKIFLYVGGISIGLAIIYLAVVKPVYRKHLDMKNKIAQKGLLLNRYNAILEQEDRLKERVAYIQNEFDKLDNILLLGAKPSLAASGLQAMLEKIIKKTNVTIINIKNKKPVEKGAFYLIPIEVTVESTLRELKDIIYHIENSDKFLFVRDLNIHLIKSENPEKLKTRLIVDGYAKKILR